MKATTAQGLTAAQRRMLVAIRDGVPYRLPATIGLRSPNLHPHLVAIARSLAKLGLLVPAIEGAGTDERLDGGTLTPRGAAIAKGML